MSRDPGPLPAGEAGPREARAQGSEGVPLRLLAWPAPAGHGRLLLVHGLGEHAARYEPLARVLQGRGYGVLAYDQRGHGRSGGRRGHVDRFELLLEDLRIVQDRMEELLPGPASPLFLYGHSMGGLVVLRYLQTTSPGPRGVVLSAPWLGTVVPIPRWKERLADLLRRTAPRLRIPTGLDPTRLTRDDELQRSYLEDPLVGRRISVGLWDAVGRAQALTLAAEVPGVPILLLLPGDDPVADSRLTGDWMGRSPWVEVSHLPGFRHEPHNELGRREVFAAVADWLDLRCGRTPAAASGAKEP